MFDATSFAHQHLAIICYSSPHLFTSQALSGWMGSDAHFQVSPEIFDWVQAQAVARTFTALCISHSFCVFKVIVLLEGEPSAQSEVLNALDWVFIISIFWCIELVFYSDESLSPCHWKTAHSMKLIPAHFTFGMVLCRWWAELLSFKHVWNWGSSDQRILFLTVWGSFRCFFANSMCLHWGEDWVWPHRHKAQIGGVLQWCLSFCRFLLSPHMIMELNQSDHQVLHHHSNQSPSPSITQFGQETSSRKSPGCFKLLPLRVTETTCFCETSMLQNCFLNSSPDVWLDSNLFLSSTDCSFDPRACFLLWYALSAIRPFIKTCAFPNHTHSIGFATGYLHSKSSNTYKQYECSWAKFQLSQIRLWIPMQWNQLSFLFLINLQRC